ncbi:hypothetical protein KBX06_09955 [Micromonospora sp. C31]|uniref:hypothetical protein n=1 Tax=Micromonospora sp. C31 TaxID=2824876 RepID=UPI001B38E30E|nr:hypothetical protein [Micromonospora sp. C31]MBQ1073486.1 hypothetical protein [Micromonospora sp. C31]
MSRRIGIGAAVARTLAADGWRLLLTGLPEFDGAQPYGGDPEGVPALLGELGDPAHVRADLLDPAAPADLVGEALRWYGRLDKAPHL